LFPKTVLEPSARFTVTVPSTNGRSPRSGPP